MARPDPVEPFYEQVNTAPEHSMRRLGQSAWILDEIRMLINRVKTQKPLAKEIRTALRKNTHC